MALYLNKEDRKEVDRVVKLVEKLKEDWDEKKVNLINKACNEIYGNRIPGASKRRDYIYRLTQRQYQEDKKEFEKTEKEYAKIDEYFEQMAAVESLLQRNEHRLPLSERPYLPDSLIEEYFENIGYEGSIDSFDWNTWQKEINDEVVEKKEPINETTVVKKEKKAKKETDQRVIEGGLFSENYCKK